jgi:hypothetical protein
MRHVGADRMGGTNVFAVIDKPCSSDEYNGLPGIMEADAAIEPLRRPLEDLVDKGSDACRSTPFAWGEVGAFLLHKHWEAQEGECMVERPGVHPSGKPALVTSAQRLTRSPKVAPSRFKIDPRRRRLVALEFSSDEFVATVWDALLEHPTFLDRACEVVGDSGLADQIGLGIFARASVPVAEGEEILEENWDQKSVLSAQVLPDDEDSVVVPTGWSFRPESAGDAGTSCIGYCMLFAGSHCSHHYKRPEVLPENLSATPPPMCTLHD